MKKEEMSIKVNLKKKKKKKTKGIAEINNLWKKKRGELWESNVVSALELDNIYIFIS